MLPVASSREYKKEEEMDLFYFLFEAAPLWHLLSVMWESSKEEAIPREQVLWGYDDLEKALRYLTNDSSFNPSFYWYIR